MYRYACMFFKLSIISSIEIILFSDIRIFAFLLYPYYQELILFKKGREWGGGLIRGGGGGACMILWSKGRALIGACALIIRGNAVMVVSVFCYSICFFYG